MLVGLDARTLTMPRPRGIGRSLRDAYAQILARRPGWQFTLYHQRPRADAGNAARQPWSFGNARWRRIDLAGDRFGTWLNVRLPLAAWADRVSLLHFPASIAPAWCPVPYVVTVHDVIPLVLPGELSPRATAAFRRGVQRALRRAAHIIAISEATRRDLLRMFGVADERITVVPWAPDLGIAEAAREPLNQAALAGLAARYELGTRWLIAFSGASPRKNTSGILAGFAHVAPSVRQGVQLLLVGCEPEERRARLAQEAERLGIAGAVRILGFIPHAELPLLLRGSSGLLMPSRYEGFGYPILDAFNCRIPVLTSDVSSMPEVAGDAAVYCQPEDPASIAAGIEQMLDPPTARELVRRGAERVAQFSWERVAEATCGVYERCAAAKPTRAGWSRTARRRMGREGLGR